MTALNLSLALASSVEGGVLLVDCDLRLPQVQERLGIAGGRGLADLLAEGGGNPSLLISRVGDLDVLTAGTKSDGRTGLLAGSRAREIFAGLRDRYRVILLDCPPVVPIADSHTLAGLADGVVMVVRARSTRPELLQRAIDSLDAGNFVGVVLNDVEFEGTSYGYAYQYYQRHYLGRRQ